MKDMRNILSDPCRFTLSEKQMSPLVNHFVEFAGHSDRIAEDDTARLSKIKGKAQRTRWERAGSAADRPAREKK
jgi:hypothetical protein